MRRKFFDTSDWRVAHSLSNLAKSLKAQGRYSEAADRIGEAIDGRLLRQDMTDSIVASLHRSLAQVHIESGHPEKAVEVLMPHLELWRSELGPKAVAKIEAILGQARDRP